MITIADIQLYPVRLRPARSDAATTESDSDNSAYASVIVKVITDSSLVGFGEAINMPGRSVSAGMEALRLSAAALIGSDALNPNEIGRRIDNAVEGIQTQWPEVRAALEMAVYDLIGKVRRVPTYSVFGGAYRTEIEMCATLQAGKPEETAFEAKQLVKQGYRGLGISVGGESGSLEQDQRAVLAILDTVSDDIPVTVLANECWENAEQVRSFFAAILTNSFYGNLAVEQPLPRQDLDGHAELRETLPISVVLNQSVVSPQVMAQIAHDAAADRIALNVCHVGGLSRANKIVHTCDSAAIGVSVRAPFSTRLGLAAHAHLASIIRDPLPVDLGIDPTPTEDPFSGGFDMIDGRLVLGDRPGLGVDLDEEILTSMTIDA